MLNVSRSYLIKLLEERKIPYRSVGSHRRIKLQDMLTYMREYQESADDALREMTADAQAMGLY